MWVKQSSALSDTHAKGYATQGEENKSEPEAPHTHLQGIRRGLGEANCSRSAPSNETDVHLRTSPRGLCTPDASCKEMPGLCCPAKSHKARHHSGVSVKQRRNRKPKTNHPKDPKMARKRAAVPEPFHFPINSKTSFFPWRSIRPSLWEKPLRVQNMVQVFNLIL